MKIALILLAAGSSLRFGSNKLYYPVEGKPMYLHILERLIQATERMDNAALHCSVTVVTQYEAIRKQAESMGVQVLDNPHPERGISSSVKIGLYANQDADACLFAVSDQPWLTEETIRNLIRGFLVSEKGIACLCADGSPGNPCLFSKTYYQELLSLTGDIGGKRVIRRHWEDTLLVPVKDIRQLADMDTCPEEET